MRRITYIMWNKKSSFQRHWGRPIRISPAVGLLDAIRAARVVAIERCSDLVEPLDAPVGAHSGAGRLDPSATL